MASRGTGSSAPPPVWALAAGLGAGLLWAASLPPLGWWPLAVAGAALLALALQGRTALGRAGAGLAAGLGLFVPGLWWVHEFSLPGAVLLTLVEAAFVAVAAAVVPARRSVLVVLPAALVLAEAVRARWPLGGLPLAGLALGQVDGPLAPAARLGGHLLLVALVGAAGAAVAALAIGERRRRAVVALLVVVGAALLGAFAPAGERRGDLRVAVVQGGGPRGLRAVFADPRTTFDAHLTASAQVSQPVDLVVWPENVVNVDGPLAGSPEEQEVADLARRLRATVVAGVVEDAGRRFRNAAVAWSPEGRMVDRYDKVHRVPFGEYVPARALVDRLADLSAVPRDALPGRGPARLVTPAGRLGVALSYEVFFPGRARAAARRGGVLLVPTNASSYRTAQVPSQELAAAQLRAVETGRWVVQAAPTGYSAVVDHWGRVRRRSGLGGREVFATSVEMRTGTPPAAAGGEAVVVVWSAVLLLGCWAGRRRRR